MLSEEEIIKVLKNHAQYTNAKVIDANTRKEYKVSEAIEGILDLYNKQNKIIDKMAEYIAPLKNEKGVAWTRIGVKEYFTKLLEEETNE